MSAKERLQHAAHRVMDPINNRMSETKHAKYVIVNGLSAVRPVLGAAGMVEAWRGNWGHAEALFGAGYSTDPADGYAARNWGAVTGGGSKLDAGADFLIRLETLAAIFPSMYKPAWFSIAGGELANAFMNQTRIQKGRHHAYIPTEAKEGARHQAVGALMYFEGKRENNPDLVDAGTATILAATLFERTKKYVELYRHPELISPEVPEEALPQAA